MKQMDQVLGAASVCSAAAPCCGSLLRLCWQLEANGAYVAVAATVAAAEGEAVPVAATADAVVQQLAVLLLKLR